MMIRSAVALVLAFAASNSMAASFDCTKAASFAEKSICKDGYLSTVDSSLADAYKKALANTLDPDRLRQLQREWIAERDQCTTQKCLDQTLGARSTFLRNYVNAEKNEAYAAEQKARNEQFAAEREAEQAAHAKQVEEYKLAEEQARLQRQQTALQQQAAYPQVAPATSAYQPQAYVATRPASQAVAEKPFLLRMWQAFWTGPGWKYTLLLGFVISCWTVWRHHKETATIYTDYTDAAITNLLPASGVVAALLLRWLEMPGLAQAIVFAIGVLLGIFYAFYATLRANQGVLNITLVVLTKLTIISVFYAVIGMLIASLFSNSGRRKGESQARTAARHRREAQATMARIVAWSAAYTALTAWICRNPEFTSISECLEFDMTPELA